MKESTSRQWPKEALQNISNDGYQKLFGLLELLKPVEANENLKSKVNRQVGTGILDLEFLEHITRQKAFE